VSACSTRNPAGPTRTESVSIKAEFQNGAPIAGTSVVTFRAEIAPASSAAGTVTWRFSDDNSTATGTTVTHVFGPLAPDGPGMPGACSLVDPTNGKWIVYPVSATFSGFPFRDEFLGLPVITRTLTGMWIDEPRREILSITSAGSVVCGTSAEGADARVRNLVGTIDGVARILTWERLPDVGGDCLEHHRALIDPNLGRLVGDVVTVDPDAGGRACHAGSTDGIWTRCEAGIDCTIR
jgi:hypothetical protein